jgi:putative membrane protein
MRILVAASLIIAILAVVFAFQNSAPVELYLGPFKLPQTPLALVMLLTLAIGVLIGYLAWLPRRLKSSRELKASRRSVQATVSSPAGQLDELASSTAPTKGPPSEPET